MKTVITKSISGILASEMVASIKVKASSNQFFVYALQLVVLFVMVFATVSAFAQSPATASTEKGKLEFVKQTAVYNSGRVYLNWVAKSNSHDCVYVVERSIDGNEYEAVGLKEGIGSPLELLYSWVDAKPIAGSVLYRITEINNSGELVANSDAQTVNTSESNVMMLDKDSRMVMVK